MWQLFLFFLKLGFLSFGGGYALIPIIEQENAVRHWIPSESFFEAVAVAGMSPGPAAINLGSVIGYEAFGIVGAIAALAGLLIPSILITAVLLFTLNRLQDNDGISKLLYGLQPIVIALILFAVYRLGIGSLSSHGEWELQLLLGILIIGLCWIMLVRYRMHPIYILLLSAICGAAFFA